MYESHFQFHTRPFVAAPQAQHYVPTTALEQARQNLIRCVERAEGPGLVVGPAGSGKTLLCQLLADHFRRQQFQVVMLASARVSSRRALFQNILFELQLPYRGMAEGELRLSLIDHLEPRGSSMAGLLLVVDEAHALPLKVLEEIRLISNFIRDGQPRVRLILAGSAQLEERLASPKLESLQQRIAARCYLQPMNREETAYYIRQQIQRAGGSEGLFTPEALKAVYSATDGVPRLVNQVCDHALVLSALGGHTQLGAEAIELHTGQYALARGAERQRELAALIAAGKLAGELGLRLHAGHGLNYHNVRPVATIAGMLELNIGHSIISRAVLVGLERAVREMKALL